MAETAVKFLLENVKNVVKDQVDLIFGAEADLGKLQVMLETMDAALKDLAEKQVKGHTNTIVQLEKHIREAVYNAEDTIDACLTQKSRDSTTRYHFPGTRNVILAKKVKELMEELKPLHDRVTRALNRSKGQMHLLLRGQEDQTIINSKS